MPRIEFTGADSEVAQQLAAHLANQGHDDVTAQRMDHGFHAVRAGDSTIAEQVESRIVLKAGGEPSAVVQAAFTWLDGRCRRVVAASYRRRVWFYALCAYSLVWGLFRSPDLFGTMADDRVVGGVAWVAWATTVVSAALFIVAYMRVGKAEAPEIGQPAVLARKSRWFTAGVGFALATLVLGIISGYGPFLVMCLLPVVGWLAAWQAFRQRRKFDVVGRLASGDFSKH